MGGWLQAAALTLASTGCIGIIDKSTLKTVAPVVMSTPDIGMGCASGEALAGTMSAMGNPAKGKTPHKAQVLLLMSAAMCLEPLAWDAELSRQTALNNHESGRVQDLLEQERRVHADAAWRYYAAWQQLDAAFALSALDEGECPRLKASRNDDLLFLLGLSTGVLGVLHDQAGGMEVGVPLDVPRRVERLAKCLDDDQWWGVPRALQAAVWASVPGALPEGEDAIATLAASAAKGRAARVRLASAFQAQTLATLGLEDALKQAIADHAADLATPADPRYRMLDRFAGQLVRHESDKLWAKAEGHRTPGAMYGTFPQPPADLDALNSLLDQLLPPSPVPVEGE